MTDPQPTPSEPFHQPTPVVESAPVPPPPPERRSRTWLYALIGGGVLAAILIGVGIGIFALNLLGRQSGIPQLLGTDTQFYATITPSLTDVPNVQRLQKAYPQLFVDKDSASADKQLENVLGVNFKDDVQPWIGQEMALAVSGLNNATLDSGALSSDGAAEELAKQAKVTIVLAARDKSKAQAFLDKQRASRSSKGQQFDQSEHNGVTIYQQKDAEQSPIAAFAMVQSYVVFASDKDMIGAMLDRDTKGKDTLESNTRFQAVKANLPTTAVGYLYVDGTAIGNAASTAIEQSLQGMPSAQASQLQDQLKNVKALQGLGASLSIASEGVQFDTAVTMDLAKLDQTANAQLEAAREPVDGERLKTISNNAVGLMTFKIPSTLKDQVMQAIKAQPNSQETLDQLKQGYDFDLEKDLLDWLVGDASLVILPGEKLGDVSLPATGYFSLRPKDRASAEAGMKKIAATLEKVLGQDGTFQFEEDTLGGTNWQVVKEPQSNSTVAGYGFAKDDLVIAFGKSALEAAGSGGSAPISDNGDFKTVTGKLSSPNGGVFYISVANMVTMLQQAGIDIDELNDGKTAQSLKPIKAVGIAGEPGLNKDGVAHARVFVFINDK